MSIRVRPRVALLVESSRSYGRELLKGIALFFRTRTNWSLLHQEMSIDATPPDWLESSGISGVIVRVDQHSVQRLRKLKVPVVDVRCRHKFEDMPRVDTDDRAVAKLAFEHLRERGFERFAYCGFQLTHYSAARLKYFRELTDQAGYPLSVYESPGGAGQQLSGAEQSRLVDDQGVSGWLKSLQPPTGLFVCNDIRGQQVLNVCRTSGIDVPDSVGVVGVDDDDAICPLCDPPMSSVRPDAHGVGYRAAEILHDMMRGVPATSHLDLVPPADRRQSTVVTGPRIRRPRDCPGLPLQTRTRLRRNQRRRCCGLRFHFETSTGTPLPTRTQSHTPRRNHRDSDSTSETITPGDARASGTDHPPRRLHPQRATLRRHSNAKPAKHRAATAAASPYSHDDNQRCVEARGSGLSSQSSAV
jgi:LacI family transcriptional regulator